MLYTAIFFLQAAGPSWVSALMPLAIIAVFYFFILGPQMKRQRTQEKFIKDLGTGKEVYTTSGIIGRVVKVEDNIVTLLVDEKTKIRVIKSSISGEMKS